MNSINQLAKPEIWLCLTTLIYFFMNGAQIFETLVFVPKWTTSPPDNFKLLLDGAGTSLKSFWIIFHSIHEITFILAIISCWNMVPTRNYLLLLFGIHFAVRIWTVLYFAANIIAFQKIAETGELVSNLATKTATWQRLNYLRVAIFIAISIALIPVCTELLKVGN